MTKLKSLLAIALFSCAIAFNGCKKDKETDEDFQTSAEDIGQAENVSSDVDNMTSQVERTGSFSTAAPADPAMDQFNFHSSCASVTNDSVNHVLTFNFGNGCTGRDGRTRAGKVIVNYTGAGYWDPGASWTISFDSFYVNTRHVEGLRTVTNNGLNAAGHMTWSINAQNMRITRTDGSFRTWNSQRTREIVSGYGDNNWSNDVYVINGTLDGTNRNGESVNCTLSNVTRDLSCHYITRGTIAITPASGITRTIDFGNGTCDDDATVTRNNVTRSIHLRF